MEDQLIDHSGPTDRRWLTFAGMAGYRPLRIFAGGVGTVMLGAGRTAERTLSINATGTTLFVNLYKESIT